MAYVSRQIIVLHKNTMYSSMKTPYLQVVYIIFQQLSTFAALNIKKREGRLPEDDLPALGDGPDYRVKTNFTVCKASSVSNTHM